MSAVAPKTEQSQTELLERAYAYCREVTRTHAKSFYFSAQFLPKSKRKPIYALYALCRLIDDEVDAAEVSNEAEAIAAVERWKIELDKVYFNAETQRHRENVQSENKGQRTKDKGQNLVLLAWRDMLTRYGVKQEHALELMRGVLMDTHIKRYRTWNELYVYCFRVASTVGLMSSEIFGYEKPETLEYAESLGIAMQLTNILRDVREDAAMGRIYLPAEDLRRFGVSEDQILSNNFDDNFLALMRFEIERARHYYQQAELGIPLLHKDARFTVLLAARIYGRILSEIERQNYNVFSSRAHTTFGQKLFSIPRIYLLARKL